jgi:predicted secreted acid phosphatase
VRIRAHRLTFLLLAAVIAGCAQETPPVVPPPPGSNALAMAVAWKSTAAEYEALYIQGFNVARMHVDRAKRDGRRKLAVISDLFCLGIDPNGRISHFRHF